MQEREVVLEISGLKTYFPIKTGIFKRTSGFIKAVDGVDLKVFKGETLGIVGESGCGKTTLCKTIVMLNSACEGKILWHDDEFGSIQLPTKDKKQLKHIRNRIQYVFQDPQSSLNPAFTVFGAMDDALKVNGVKSRKERRQIVCDLLRSVNMREDALDLYPHEFSGGQRQRIGIARALCVKPELLICDEAVSALDVSIQAQVLHLLCDLKNRLGLTFLFITHSLSVVEYISDRIAVMYLGRIVELGDTDDLFQNMFHPYTQALRSAVPVVDDSQRTTRILLSGDVPNPADPPPGCAFHERCWRCMPECKVETPKLRSYKVNDKDYYVACHEVHEKLKDKEIGTNGDK